MPSITLNLNVTFQLNETLTDDEVEEFADLVTEELSVILSEYEEGVPKTFNDEIDEKVDEDASAQVEYKYATQDDE